MDATLEFEQVIKIYPGEIRALDNFSLEVRSEELLSLVGPSGCGKTTALRIAAGLEPVDQGVVRLDRRDAAAVPPHQRHVALVPQRPALLLHRTVEENLEFPLRLRRVPRQLRQQAAQGIAQRLGISRWLNSRPGTLSGGEFQRVLLGRALVGKPRFLLLDEPLSQLDAPLRLELRGLIGQLQRQSKLTTIFVTHDQQDALALGDRVAVMQGGRILQIGEPDEVYSEPANRQVAAFIGTPPMNFISGSLERDSEGGIFRALAGQVPLPRWMTEVLPGRNGTATGLGRDVRQVELGVRPEHVRIGLGRRHGWITLGQGIVQCSERWSDRRYVQLNLIGRNEGGHSQPSPQIVAAVPDGGPVPTVGHTLEMTAKLRDVHLFEAGPTGTNLTRGLNRSSWPD